MDSRAYLKKQEEKFNEYEAVCRRCGECCGAFGSDPCASLIKQPDGTYLCNVYENRLGMQKTVSGRTFTCVMIDEVRKNGVFYYSCSYRNK